MDDQTPQDPVTPFSGTALVERPRAAVPAVRPTDLLAEESGESKTPPPPARIGRYRILSPLAQGGMARVFIAQRDGAQGICVVKQLLGDLEKNEIATRRFRREAHVAAYLSHQNVARVIDAGEEDGTFYMAMEYIEGKDIEGMSHELLHRHRLLPYPITVTALCGILDGLAYAHRATDPSGTWMQVVHRDLSPRNMMLTFRGEAKVIDFGMAKGTFDSFKTSPGMVLGTLRFVSPEQATAEPVDARADLYSVAVVLFELLTGHMLVKPAAAFEMMKKVVHDVPPLVRSLNETLPAALDAVVARGLAKKPDDRFQSAEEFRHALMTAVPEWCNTPGALMGDFMREQFPADVEKMRAHLARGGATPAGFDTSGGAQKTRTVMAGELTGPAPSTTDEDNEWVRPQTMVTSEIALTTRTGLVFPELTQTAAGMPRIMLREPDLLDTAEDEPSRPTVRDSLPPQPLTVRVSMPPTQITPAPRAAAPASGWARERLAEMRGALIATAVIGAAFAVWQLVRAPDGTEVVTVVPVTAAPTPGAVKASPVASPAASPAASRPAASAEASRSSPAPGRSPSPVPSRTTEPTSASPVASRTPEHTPTPKPTSPASEQTGPKARRAVALGQKIIADTTYETPAKNPTFMDFLAAAEEAASELPEEARLSLRLAISAAEQDAQDGRRDGTRALVGLLSKPR